MSLDTKTENIEGEWMNFLSKYDTNTSGRIMTTISSVPHKTHEYGVIPKPTINVYGGDVSDKNEIDIQEYELNISTKTKILYLNQTVDISPLFWKIPVIEYWQPKEGVVKKQIKIVSKTPEEFEEYQKHLVGIEHYNENIIKQINNPLARSIKFKDERKITVGISRKDIMNCRGKVKNAFYNCFAIIIRVVFEGVFREIHVKVFNTGKMEIPGVVSVVLLDIVKKMVLNVMNNLDSPILFDFLENIPDSNVLINSNFNCGYFINREVLHSILRSSKYDIEAVYDPCSYPGVKCKFYFNNELGFDEFVDVDNDPDNIHDYKCNILKCRQNGKIMKEDCHMKMSELSDTDKYTEVSFMIFRTGSGLIVGNCTEKVLMYVFRFIQSILSMEKANIMVMTSEVIVKCKKPKLRKRTINMTSDYFNKTYGVSL
jgi:hypothetical protein